MKLEIKKRLKEGKRLTKRQIEYLRETVDPKFDLACAHCRFNAKVCVGLDPFPKTRR